MYQIGDKILFSSYTEAKFAILSKIELILQTGRIDARIKNKLSSWKEQVQKAIEDHTKDMATLCQFYGTLSESERNDIAFAITSDFIQTVRESPYDLLTTANRFKDALIREADGTLPSLLLLKPTPTMLEVTRKISEKIISYLEYYLINNFTYKLGNTSKNYTDEFKTLALNFLAHIPDTMYTGGFSLDEVNRYLESKNIPPLRENAKNPGAISILQARAILELGIKVLRENTHLERIMSFHFRFYKCVLRVTPVFTSESQTPTEQFKRLLSPKYENHAQYYLDMKLPGDVGYAARKYISDDLIFFSPYYMIDPSKGRLGNPDFSKETSCYGIFRLEDIDKIKAQNPAHLLIPVPHAPWASDTVCQDANFDSIVVKSSLEHEAAFVSGPSGTYAFLTGLQELLINPQDDKERQIYLQCMLAYIVGTGLHSTHEVLGPAAHLMNLIPGYATAIPSLDHPIPAPCFSKFYDLACANDKDFESRRDEAWQRMIHFFNDYYMQRPHLMNGRDLFVEIIGSLNRLEPFSARTIKLNAVNYLLDKGVFPPTFVNDFNEEEHVLAYAFNSDKELFQLLIESNTVPDTEEKRMLSLLFQRMKSTSKPEHFNLQYDAGNRCLFLKPENYYDQAEDMTVSSNLAKLTQEIEQYMHQLNLVGVRWVERAQLIGTELMVANQGGITWQLLHEPAGIEEQATLTPAATMIHGLSLSKESTKSSEHLPHPGDPLQKKRN